MTDQTTPISQQTQSTVVTALGLFLRPEQILWAEEDTRPYECDGLSAYRQLAMVVVLPENEKQVENILRTCHHLGVPVVPRGAGTGLSGGALPMGNGVLLSVAKMNKILEIRAEAGYARVQPGVRNLAISEAAAPWGLYYAPDPSSQIACSIGGNVAENSGGVHCLKYGLTLHNVFSVTGYTMQGERVTLGGLMPDPPGYDLLAVVIGSEGMLVVVTEIIVRLIPRPPVQKVALASFARIQSAADAVAAIIAAGIIPAGLEMMDKAATAAVEQYVHAGYDLDAAALLLCESDGTEEEVNDEMGRILQVLKEAGATRVTVSSNEEERLRVWSGRKAAFPAVGRISPDYYCMDGTVPRRSLSNLLSFIAEMEQKYNLRCPNVFHAGDGNLHPLILYDANQPDELARTESFAAEVLERCIALGGTITGEHGVGIEKINQMCIQFSADELDIFRGLKLAFDPQGLLNPGKNIPSLHRCAEMGGMHVHQGALPHPDLPRF